MRCYDFSYMFEFFFKETKIHVKDRTSPPMCSFVGTSCYFHCKYTHHLTRTSNFQLKCGTRFHKLLQILEQRRTLENWNEKFNAYFSSIILYKKKQNRVKDWKTQHISIVFGHCKNYNKKCLRTCSQYLKWYKIWTNILKLTSLH